MSLLRKSYRTDRPGRGNGRDVELVVAVAFPCDGTIAVVVRGPGRARLVSPAKSSCCGRSAVVGRDHDVEVVVAVAFPSDIHPPFRGEGGSTDSCRKRITLEIGCKPFEPSNIGCPAVAVHLLLDPRPAAHFIARISTVRRVGARRAGPTQKLGSSRLRCLAASDRAC